MKSSVLKKVIVAIIIFAVVVAIGLAVSKVLTKDNSQVVVGAVGGGKENFMADPEIIAIMKDKYGIVVDGRSWSNNKLVKDPLTYDENGKENNYDFAFFSDERFYEYYKQPAGEGEAPRLPIKDGNVVLSTPIVFYSWKEVADVLEKDGIVSNQGGTYYISDMPKLLSYIEENKKWQDIGLTDTYGAINIASTDPVTSSPGATYYGLLASIMQGGQVDINNVNTVMPELQDFYKFSGFLNNTPADLFDLYLRTGRGAYPIIVDYEKSMLDFAINNPTGYDQIKDRVVVLYSQPTIWNSHCIVSFSEAGNKYMEALNDPDIQRIAWEKYGFRTSVVGSGYDIEKIAVNGVPQEIISVVPGLKKEIYDIMIEKLKEVV